MYNLGPLWYDGTNDEEEGTIMDYDIITLDHCIILRIKGSYVSAYQTYPEVSRTIDAYRGRSI